MRARQPACSIFALALLAVFAIGCQSRSDSPAASSVSQETGATENQQQPVGVKTQPREHIRYQWAPHVDIDAPHRGSLVDFSKLSTAIPEGTPRRPSDDKERHTILPPEELDRLRAEALLVEPNANIQIADRGPATQGPTLGNSFEALNFDDTPNSTPPDPEMAVGPNHIIAVVNTAIEIYSKAGTTLSGPTQLNTFFAGTPGFPGGSFDPNALYDESTDRFIIGTDANGSDYCIAATTGPDPTSTWHRYCLATDVGGAFFDYPHVGVGEEAIFLGSNQFTGSFLEGRVWAVNKANLLSGAPLGTIPSESTGGDSTPWPADLHGFAQGTWPSGTSTHYIMTETFDGCNHNVWTWDDPFGSGGFSKGANLDLCTATGVTAAFPVAWPNSGGGSLQANDWRGQSTFYRNGYLWMTTQGISCNPGSGTVDCVRWAQIDPMANTIMDAGVYSSNDDFRTFPSLAVNHCNDMAVGYSKGSTSTFPATWVNGRLHSDPVGNLGTETQLKAGEETFDCFDGAPYRWGDYTGMTIDPDGGTFWYLGQYSRANSGSCDWATYIGSFTFDSCAVDEIFADGFESGDTLAWSTTSQ